MLAWLVIDLTFFFLNSFTNFCDHFLYLGETFTVVIDPDTALEEIVDVTAVSTNTLTITRGIDGSSGQAHSAGAVVRHKAIVS